ncbi:MAG: PEP-CTERM sorting domain-containing protein [Gammaproteobacteria bacterium]
MKQQVEKICLAGMLVAVTMMASIGAQAEPMCGPGEYWDGDYCIADQGPMEPVSAPEPTTLALLSLGLVGLGITRRKKRA